VHRLPWDELALASGHFPTTPTATVPERLLDLGCLHVDGSAHPVSRIPPPFPGTNVGDKVHTSGIAGKEDSATGVWWWKLGHVSASTRGCRNQHQTAYSLTSNTPYVCASCEQALVLSGIFGSYALDEIFSYAQGVPTSLDALASVDWKGAWPAGIHACMHS